MRINREEAMEGTEDLEAMVTEDMEAMATEVLEVMGGPGVMVTEDLEVPEVMEGQVENTEAEREGNMEVANMDR